jgi:hypothetical protein
MKRQTLIWTVILIVLVGAALLYIQSRNDADDAYANAMRTLAHEVDVDVTNRYATRYAQALLTSAP